MSLFANVNAAGEPIIHPQRILHSPPRQGETESEAVDVKPAKSMISVADVQSYIAECRWTKNRPPFSEHTIIIIAFVVASKVNPQACYTFNEIVAMMSSLFFYYALTFAFQVRQALPSDRLVTWDRLFDAFCSFELPLERVGNGTFGNTQFRLLSVSQGLCYLSHFMYPAHPHLVGSYTGHNSIKDLMRRLSTELRLVIWKHIFTFPNSGIRIGYNIRPRSDRPGTVKQRCGGMDIMMLTRDPDAAVNRIVWHQHDKRASLDAEKDDIIVSALGLRTLYGLMHDTTFGGEVKEVFYGCNTFVFANLQDLLSQLGWLEQEWLDKLLSISLVWNSSMEDSYLPMVSNALDLLERCRGLGTLHIGLIYSVHDYLDDGTNALFEEDCYLPFLDFLRNMHQLKLEEVWIDDAVDWMVDVLAVDLRDLRQVQGMPKVFMNQEELGNKHAEEAERVPDDERVFGPRQLAARLAQWQAASSE